MKYQTPIEGTPYGAVLNTMQLDLLYSMFRIHPWTYYDKNPFRLRDELDEQERAAKELGI